MRSFIVRSIVAGILVLMMASAAAAQLSEEYAGWADGPAGFLLTKKERSEWERLSSDAEAKAFIELFWARRNPDSNAAYNPFRDEFEAKVKYADEHFGTGDRRGALSDRARVLILMGRPKGAQTQGPQQTLPPVGERGGSDSVEGSTQVWFYDPATLPEGFKLKGSELYFMFYEEQPGSNDYVLDRSNRRAFKGLTALEKAPEVHVLHPDLREVPRPVTMAGARPAPASLATWLEGEGPFDETARVVVEHGVADTINRPVWVHVELPPEAPEIDTLAGRVLSSAGEVLSTFEIDTAPVQGQYGPAHHLTFRLDPGAYSIELAGAAGGAPQVTERFSVEVSPVPGEGTWMSPLALGVTADPEPEAKLGTAFTYGGWHLVPVTGPDLDRDAEILFFGFVVRPGLGEDGAPDLKAKVGLTHNGKAMGRPVTMPLDASEILPDLYMYGSSIPLSGLPEPGSYELEFEIREGVSESFVERLMPLEIAAVEAP